MTAALPVPSRAVSRQLAALAQQESVSTAYMRLTKPGAARTPVWCQPFRDVCGETRDEECECQDTGWKVAISRFSARAIVGHFTLTVLNAWLAWLGLHLPHILEFKNQVSMLHSSSATLRVGRRGKRTNTGRPLMF